MGDSYTIPPLSAIEMHEGSTVLAGLDGQEVELELTTVEVREASDDAERFSLLFRGPVSEPLGQGSYRLAHPELGAFDAVLVPVIGADQSPDSAWTYYEAVVDRPPSIPAESPAQGPSRRGFLARAGLAVLATGFLGSLFGSQPARAAAGAEPFLGSIGLFGGNFAPRGWAMCDGQLLPIAQNSALFSILGTTYGGDGRTTFGLPDLRGRVPVHAGNGPGLSPVSLGQKDGVSDVTLTTTHLPAHTHGASFDGSGSFSLPVTTETGDSTSPDGNVLASPASAVGRAPASPIYSTTTTPDGSMAIDGSASGGVTVDAAGGGQSHTNMQPYLGVNYIIATVGIFPSRD